MPEIDAKIAFLDLENPIIDPSEADLELPAEVVDPTETAVDEFYTPPKCRLWREMGLLGTIWGWLEIVGVTVPLSVNRGFSGDLSRGRASIPLPSHGAAYRARKGLWPCVASPGSGRRRWCRASRGISRCREGGS